MIHHSVSKVFFISFFFYLVVSIGDLGMGKIWVPPLFESTSCQPIGGQDGGQNFVVSVSHFSSALTIDLLFSPSFAAPSNPLKIIPFSFSHLPFLLSLFFMELFHLLRFFLCFLDFFLFLLLLFLLSISFFCFFSFSSLTHLTPYPLGVLDSRSTLYS